MNISLGMLVMIDQVKVYIKKIRPIKMMILQGIII